MQNVMPSGGQTPARTATFASKAISDRTATERSNTVGQGFSRGTRRSQRRSSSSR